MSLCGCQVMELSEQVTQFQERLLDQTEELQHANTELEQLKQQRDALSATHDKHVQLLTDERNQLQVRRFIFVIFLHSCLLHAIRTRTDFSQTEVLQQSFIWFPPCIRILCVTDEFFQQFVYCDTFSIHDI